MTYQHYEKKMRDASREAYGKYWRIHHVMEIVDKANKDYDLPIHEYTKLCHLAHEICAEIEKKL